jgi:hypothetical protein
MVRASVATVGHNRSDDTKTNQLNASFIRFSRRGKQRWLFHGHETPVLSLFLNICKTVLFADMSFYLISIKLT